MSLLKPVHEFDTRQNPTVTVFDGSRTDENKLATQFWSTVVLVPPVESTLACREIKQRTQSRPLNGDNKPRYTAAMTKAMKEKALRDKEYDEIAALKQAEDENKRIQSTRQRQQELRQLFYHQATTNRFRYREWAVPPVRKHEQDITICYPNETDDNDEYDRQLVRWLPD
ncbi:unnamed protein product [Adineta ricciae]|uniref:Cilia- and flagella-associated protein HOATZ n=1 Tax=Adineta ricciae TaxID=249248 RepID=A0A814NG89_ADIRI|nr:unnamed protein product [Adineta ricciae]